MAKALKPTTKTSKVVKDVVDAVVVDETSIYDATKNYKWNPEDTFVLSGQEYAFMFNTLMLKKTELLAQLEVLNVLESKLQKAVDEGVAVEISQEELEAQTQK